MQFLFDFDLRCLKYNNVSYFSLKLYNNLPVCY